jgi:predicted anti-sigma-YlaC factor YlaD
MNRDSLTPDLHERARMLIALSGPQEISTRDQSWLAAHLDSCASCREFAERTRETIRALRASPVMASANLVSATRARVRQRSQELHRRQERLRVIWVCSAAVTVCTAVNTLLLWRGVAWAIDQWANQQWLPSGLSAPLWMTVFLVFCFMPALVTGILLLARGTYFTDHTGSYQD